MKYNDYCFLLLIVSHSFLYAMDSKPNTKEQEFIQTIDELSSNVPEWQLKRLKKIYYALKAEHQTDIKELQVHLRIKSLVVDLAKTKLQTTEAELKKVQEQLKDTQQWGKELNEECVRLTHAEMQQQKKNGEDRGLIFAKL